MRGICADMFLHMLPRICVQRHKLERQCRRVCICDMSVQMMLCYLILVALFVNGDDEFGDVCDKLITFSFPQGLYADLQMLH